MKNSSTIPEWLYLDWFRKYSVSSNNSSSLLPLSARGVAWIKAPCTVWSPAWQFVWHLIYAIPFAVLADLFISRVHFAKRFERKKTSWSCSSWSLNTPISHTNTEKQLMLRIYWWWKGQIRVQYRLPVSYCDLYLHKMYRRMKKKAARAAKSTNANRFIPLQIISYWFYRDYYYYCSIRSTYWKSGCTLQSGGDLLSLGQMPS